ncbi:Hypothetical predicted protein [Paramuricea clavata]|uniref:Uncharacterized protein n=1 Tax=Paramuricea clavata TaxID=317549 RepID=A0A6S7HD80_PARCT|nr:Hypothetical predicted protein [Paramuricea clavata]
MSIKVNCGSSVDHQDINAYVNKCSCYNCRRVMQKARLIVTEAESWARKNFVITCYCDHFSVVLYSGSRYHEAVVQLCGGELRVDTNITSWTECIKTVVRRKWSNFVDTAFSIAGLVTGVGKFLSGSVLKALTFK